MLLGFWRGADAAGVERSEIRAREYRDEGDDAVGSSDQRKKKKNLREGIT